MLAQVAEGDNDAFARLYHKYRQKLYSYLFNLTRSDADAEDGMQEIFISIFRNRHKLSSVDNFDGYLFIASKNYFLTLVKKKSGISLSDDLSYLSIPVSGTPEEMLKHKQLKEFYEKVKTELPEQQRRAFSLSRDKGYTIAQIAEAMEISESTAKEHVSKALKTIRQKISGYLNPLLVLILGEIFIF